MTDQIERCLCGGDVECLSGDTTLTSWMVCGWCDYESTTFESRTDAITTHNWMMVAARAPAEDIDALRRHAAAMTTQANLAHQALLDERRQWEVERSAILAQSDAYWRQLQQAAEHLDEVIAAHKQQIADLTDALAPVEWEPGRVPTEPGWYAWRQDIDAPEVLRVDIYCGMLSVIHDDDSSTAMYYWDETTPGQWLGPVILPRKRG